VLEAAERRRSGDLSPWNKLSVPPFTMEDITCFVCCGNSTNVRTSNEHLVFGFVIVLEFHESAFIRFFALICIELLARNI